MRVLSGLLLAALVLLQYRLWVADDGFREVWQLQPRLEARNPRSVHKVLGHKRFRAAFDFLTLNGHRPFVLVDAVAIKHTHFNNRPGNTRRQLERRITNIRGLFTKDSAQQFFFWG